MTSGATALLGLQPQQRRQDNGRMECDATTRGVPVLDPRRDLKGATPETLARDLLRPPGPPPAVARGVNLSL